MSPKGPAPRPELEQVPPKVHGSTRLAELRRWRMPPERVLDFSANINPFGPPPSVLQALQHVPIDRYPDPDALLLREALAGRHGVDVAQILVGNGVSELILLVALAFIRPRDRVLILEPTYGEYRRVSALMGAVIHTWRARPEDGFNWDLQAVERALRQQSPRVVWACHPNNPTAAVCPPETLATWAKTFPETLFVVDEAYINLAPGLRSALSVPQPNVLVLRSLTKDFALPGVRLGYAIGHPEVIDALAQVQPPWSVNAFAQAAGLAALSEDTFLRETVEQLHCAKERLVQALEALGWPVLPSCTPFFLVRVGNARRFREKLLSRGVLVRDGTSFGLPQYVRISTRRPEENAQLLATIQDVYPHGPEDEASDARAT